MSHVFISYSKRNKPYARQLAAYLITSGFDVWIDDRIDYGSLWVDVIQKAIEDCAAFVVIMTPEARESRWVQTECEYAAQEGKGVFPLLLDGEVFFRYVSVQYADVTDGSMPLDTFLDEVAEHAPRTPGQGADVTAPEACEVKRPDAVPPAKSKIRKRSRTPVYAGASIVAVLLLMAVAFVLQSQLTDDPDDEPTQVEVGQAASPTGETVSITTPTGEVAQIAPRTSEPVLHATNTPHTGDCRYDWFFGNDHALPDDCPTSEPIEFEGFVQNYGEGVLLGLYVNNGRFFILHNDGHYVDRVGEWDMTSAPVGECALQTAWGLAALYADNNTPDEIIGCPLEPVQVEKLYYQTSNASNEFVVYIGVPDGSEAYRLSAPTSRPGTDDGAWQRVR